MEKENRKWKKKMEKRKNMNFVKRSEMLEMFL